MDKRMRFYGQKNIFSFLLSRVRGDDNREDYAEKDDNVYVYDDEDVKMTHLHHHHLPLHRHTDSPLLPPAPL
jgi:hypothetical protein